MLLLLCSLLVQLFGVIPRHLTKDRQVLRTRILQSQFPLFFKGYLWLTREFWLYDVRSLPFSLNFGHFLSFLTLFCLIFSIFEIFKLIWFDIISSCSSKILSDVDRRQGSPQLRLQLIYLILLAINYIIIKNR